MKKLTRTILTCGALASCLQLANAAPTMRLSADNGATWVIVPDNSPLDFNPAAGAILYIGPIGTWDGTVAGATGSPLVGSPTQPDMDVSCQSDSSGPATLIVQMSDSGFVPANNQAFINAFGGHSDGTVTHNVYRDVGNVLFGTTANYAGDPAGVSPSPTASLLFSTGPVTGNIGTSNGVVVANGGNTSYSLTLETVVFQNGAGSTSLDGHLSTSTPPPPPCNCTVTFNSPSSITNCADDVIPPVTAYQVCQDGLSNAVQVTFIGASTNGTCPKLITRTNTAMDACGNLYTNVQTVTVNCRGSICGNIFADCDGNGDLTAGDVGLKNVIVSLLVSNKVVVSIMTDTNGHYCFTNLTAGTYVVAVTPPSGYTQTGGSTAYHWRDSYGRDCWNENDGYIHCTSSGTECWWDKYSNCHWKDSYGRDCWKDYWGYHCQPCNYTSCNSQTNNNKLTVTLGNCSSQGDVDFALTGTKTSVSCNVTGPTYVKCGQTYTYTCYVTNTGNVCIDGGTICHKIGNCDYYGNWYWGCQTFNVSCPPLSPGQWCKVTQKCTFTSYNCGTVTCQSTANCRPRSSSYGSYCYDDSKWYSQCGW